MFPKRWVRGSSAGCWLVVAVWMSLPVVGPVLGPVFGDETERMTARQFAAFSDGEQRAAITRALEERIRKTQNVRVVSVTRTFNVRYENGKEGERIPEKDFGWKECELRRMGGSRWSHVRWIHPSKGLEPAVEEVTLYDGEEKRRWSTTKYAKLEQVYGGIGDHQEGGIMTGGRIHYWFDLPIDKDVRQFPLGSLLSRVSELKFGKLDEEAGTVEVTWLEMLNKIMGETREMTLDVAKGFLPMRDSRVIRYVNKPGELPFDMPIVVVEEAREVGGVWFPWKMRKFNGGCEFVVKEKWMTIQETEVRELSLGTVKEEDLRFEFPPGTMVRDHLRGVWMKDGEVMVRETVEAAAASGGPPVMLAPMVVPAGK